MKKITTTIMIFIMGITIFLLGFSYQKGSEPKTYYRVYLGEEVIGTITSKNKLQKYIDSENAYIKQKYGVKKIYEPKNLYIKKITSYEDSVNTVKEVYQKIAAKEPFTVKGYQLSIKRAKNDQKIYVLNEQIFNKATVKLIETYVGKDNYKAYLDQTQKKINPTGTIIENIYIEDNITIKEAYIPISETIYTKETDLAQFLLFGSNQEQRKYTIKLGDTINSVSFDNKISPKEFLMSNLNFSNESNLLYPGQEVVIGIPDPQLKVVSVAHVIEDRISAYRTEEKFDENKYMGDNEVLQVGENGLERIEENIRTVNGIDLYVKNIGKQVLKPTINEIVVRGGKVDPNVGSLTNWLWPTDSGWKISSYYGFRIDPFSGARDKHNGVDIAGLPYGSAIVASNHGTVIEAKFTWDYGYHVIIDHNNGYYSLYGHLDRISKNITIGQTITRGKLLGYLGNSGMSTGPHLHYEMWRNCSYCRIDPWNFIR